MIEILFYTCPNYKTRQYTVISYKRGKISSVIEKLSFNNLLNLKDSLFKKGEILKVTEVKNVKDLKVNITDLDNFIHEHEE